MSHTHEHLHVIVREGRNERRGEVGRRVEHLMEHRVLIHVRRRKRTHVRDCAEESDLRRGRPLAEFEEVERVPWQLAIAVLARTAASFSCFGFRSWRRRRNRR